MDCDYVTEHKVQDNIKGEGITISSESSHMDEESAGGDYGQTLLRIWGYDPSFGRLRVILLFEMAGNIFQGLLNEIGPSRTLEAVKPYGLIYGHNIANIVRRATGMQGNDALNVAMPYYYGLYCASNGKIKPLEIRDGKAFLEMYDCIAVSAKTPPEVCAMSHFNSEGVCQTINPSYEFVWTHHLGSGDSCCRFVVKKKSDKLNPKDFTKSEEADGRSQIEICLNDLKKKSVYYNIEELGKLDMSIPLDLPQAERDLTSLGIAFNYFNIFTTVSINTIGSQRTNDLGKPFARKTGLNLGIKLKGDFQGNDDLDWIREKIEYVQNGLGQRGEAAIITNSTIEKEIVECPFKNGLIEQCNHLEGMLAGVCEALNPDYEFAFDRMMTKGDSTCHWVVKKKEVEKYTEEASAEKPLKVLAQRLAKGEISLEEFERTIASMRKDGLIE